MARLREVVVSLSGVLLGSGGCSEPTQTEDTATEDSSSEVGSAGSEDSTTAPETETSTDTGADTSTGTSTDTGTDTGDEDPPYPDPDWPTGAPEDHGLSSAGLDDLAEVAAGFDSNCLLVIHEGALVGEWYWNGYDVDTRQANVFSVTKSVMSAVVGIAQDQDLLSVDDFAAEYIDEWAGTESDAITIRDLLSNDSGREWSFTTDYLQMTSASDQTQFSVDLGQDWVPNVWWEYNNSAIQTLERVLEVATGEDVGAYALANLLTPIGADVLIGHDGAGNVQTYQGISASCDDLARLGYLFLREGTWAGGVQVVPASWVAESTVPSQNLNTAYGYLWWLNAPGHYVLPSAPTRVEADGQLLDTAPDELFAAVGALGQLILVDPVGGYVIVRLGDAPDLADLTGFDKLTAIWDAFAAAQL